MSDFFDWMQKREIKKPTQMNFNKNKWVKEVGNRVNNEEDRQLYEATIFVSEKLVEIRNKMIELDCNFHPKNLSYDDLLKRMADYSNFKLLENVISIRHNVLNSKNPITSLNKNDMTHDEASHACIDAFSSAIDFLIYCKNANENKVNGNKKEINFFIKELYYYSGFYGSISSHYNGVLYKQYDFIKESEKVIFKEKNNERTLSDLECYYNLYLDYYNQKEKNKYDILSDDRLNFKEIHVKKEGRNNYFTTKYCTDDSKLHFYFYIYNLNRVFSQCIDENYNERITSKGFNRDELVKIFSHLIVFSTNLIDSFINKIESRDIRTNFSPSSFTSCYSIIDLANSLAKVSGIHTSIVLKIIDFLTYIPGENKDIWAFPIIKKDKNKICLLLGAAMAPTPSRVVECWFKYLNVKVESKGSGFEKEMFSILDGLISNNPILKNNVSIYTNKNLSTGNQDEEIDLIIKIDKSIIVMDLKSIVSIDSPVSSFRSHSRIKYGVEQVKRKINFIKNNIDYVNEALNINDLADCTFYPYVLVSNGSMSGCIIDDVPIVNRDTFFNYFTGNDLDLLVVDGITSAKIKLYSSIEDAKINFDIYFRNPINARRNFDTYDYKSGFINREGNILIERLVRKELSTSDVVDRLKKYSIFKVNFIKNTDDIINDKKLYTL
ncbi:MULTISPECIES: hypothetical protein [Pectobacterium]|uniref:hypothetical protein n=1 Tax=Pectobacterium TaxID=122277 RepID=UPI000E22FF0A|nr:MULTISPECIES: hypothetical protein [Pectobacterium]RJL20334.1 hypothetical protein D5074_16340 [Pectobacterium polaris]RRO01591.1 hypothetical protein DMB81_020050 [Pectobacterium aquaticum]